MHQIDIFIMSHYTLSYTFTIDLKKTTNCNNDERYFKMELLPLLRKTEKLQNYLS